MKLIHGLELVLGLGLTPITSRGTEGVIQLVKQSLTTEKFR
jgi:hypothetical protein